MPDNTTHLLLPYILAAQAQKHVTHNEALRLLDAMVQLSVLDRDLTAPPASPADGDRHIVASGGTGDWAGWDLNVAYWVDGVWMRLVPRPGWLAWIADERLLLVHDGVGWVGTTPEALQNLALLGLGTTADAANPFSAKLNAALWTARTVAEGGTGDLFYTMNKEAAGDDLGLSLQTGFSTRALMGLFAPTGFASRSRPMAAPSSMASASTTPPASSISPGCPASRPGPTSTITSASGPGRRSASTTPTITTRTHSTPPATTS